MQALDRLETRLPGGTPPGKSPVVHERGDVPGSFFGDTRRLGLLVFMGTVTMLFIGFTSAYILRRASADWAPLAAPPLLWVNTAALVASSVLLELARRALRGFNLESTRRFFAAGGILGAAFVAGQFGAWKQLAAQGVFLSSNPHSAFFYVLTGLHALHVFGGLAWYVALQVALVRAKLVRGGDGLGLFALYWHFLGALWLYLLGLLFLY